MLQRNCEFCHYTKDNCYKLTGYPEDWKQRKKSRHGLLTRTHELSKSQINQVHLPTRDKVKIVHVGETSVSENEFVKNVLFYTRFHSNSVRKVVQVSYRLSYQLK